MNARLFPAVARLLGSLGHIAGLLKREREMSIILALPREGL